MTRSSGADAERLMPTSVMPKGVEHQRCGGSPTAAVAMPTSVMPKGVEHTDIGRLRDRTSCMPTSVMPKGVEHLKPADVAGEVYRHAHLCDAERR